MKVLVLLLTLPVNAAIGKPTGTQITSTIVELQKAGSPILISNPFGNPIGKNSNSYQSKALADTARGLKDTGASPLKIRTYLRACLHLPLHQPGIKLAYQLDHPWPNP